MLCVDWDCKKYGACTLTARRPACDAGGAGSIPVRYPPECSSVCEERLLREQEAGGSNPLTPIFDNREDVFRGVAQAGRAPALGAGGRRFESGCPEFIAPPSGSGAR